MPFHKPDTVLSEPTAPPALAPTVVVQVPKTFFQPHLYPNAELLLPHLSAPRASRRTAVFPEPFKCATKDEPPTATLLAEVPAAAPVPEPNPDAVKLLPS